MTSTAPIRSEDLLATSFAYVDCDIPDGQTLADWRRLRNAERAALRPSWRVRLRLRRARWAS